MRTAVFWIVILAAVADICCYKFLVLKKSENDQVFVGLNSEDGVSKIITFNGNKDKSIQVFDYHYKNKMIFYSGKSINLMRFGCSYDECGTTHEVVNTPVEDLAVDWVEDRIYWTSGFTLSRANLNGTNKRTVPLNITIEEELLTPTYTSFTRERELPTLERVVLDPYKKILFFNVVSDEKRILFRADFSGTNTRRLPTASDERGYFTLDLDTRKVYLQQSKKLCIMNYDGTDVIAYKVLLEPVFQFFRDEVFLAFRTTMNTTHFKRGKLTLNGSLEMNSKTISLENNVTALRVFEQDSQLSRNAYYIRQCEKLNCTNKCLVLPVSGAACVKQCVTEGGMVLEDGLFTKGNTGQFILYSTKFTLKDKIQYFPGFSVSRAIDFYHSMRYLIYYSPSHNAIYRQTYDNLRHLSLGQPIKDKVTGVLGLAVDWVNSNIYWVDLPALNLYISDINGRNVQLRNLDKHLPYNTVVLNSENYTNHVALDPYASFLFVVPVLNDGTYKILNFDLSKDDQDPFNTVGKGTITSIAIDVVRERLFYAIKEPDKVSIHMCDYYLTTVLSYQFSEIIGNVVSMSVFRNHFVFISHDPTYGHKKNSFTLGEKQTLLTTPTGKVYFHKFISPYIQMDSKDRQCLKSNCSHICNWLDKNTTKCDCPEGFSLQVDNTTCHKDPETTTSTTTTTTTTTNTETGTYPPIVRPTPARPTPIPRRPTTVGSTTEILKTTTEILETTTDPTNMTSEDPETTTTPPQNDTSTTTESPRTPPDFDFPEIGFGIKVSVSCVTIILLVAIIRAKRNFSYKKLLRR